MIGVYDSGYGGLTILRALQAVLPKQDWVFLGDSGRAPYGGRDAHTLLDFAEQCVERLFEEGCDVVVVACHTISCVGLRHLQQRYGPKRRILGVTIPAAEAAVAQSQGHIAWLGTARTIASGTYAVEIRKLNPLAQVYGVAAPLLAPLVEEGLDEADQMMLRLCVRRYLRQLPALTDTLVLGCTHYPLLADVMTEELPGHIHLLDPSPHVALRLADWLTRHPEYDQPGQGHLRVLCSGDPEVFARQGARFLGKPLPCVAHVAEVQGRLAHRHPSDAPLGQVVR